VSNREHKLSDNQPTLEDALSILGDILLDATGDIYNPDKRLWPIRAEYYRRATAILSEPSGPLRLNALAGNSRNNVVRIAGNREALLLLRDTITLALSGPGSTHAAEHELNDRTGLMFEVTCEKDLT
jgi:hypothetical protein